MGTKRENLTKLEKKVLEYYLALRHRKDVDARIYDSDDGTRTRKGTSCSIFDSKGHTLCQVIGKANFHNREYFWDIVIPSPSSSYCLICENYLVTKFAAHAIRGEFMPVLEWAFERAFAEEKDKDACEYMDGLMEENKRYC